MTLNEEYELKDQLYKDPNKCPEFGLMASCGKCHRPYQNQHSNSKKNQLDLIDLHYCLLCQIKHFVEDLNGRNTNSSSLSPCRI